LVIDLSSPIENQKKQIIFWINYLQQSKIKLEEINNKFSIIVVGTKYDKIKNEENIKNEIKKILNEFKQKKEISYWKLVSGLKNIEINSLKKIIFEEGKKILMKNNKIPKSYKKCATELINKKRISTLFLKGSLICLILTETES